MREPEAARLAVAARYGLPAPQSHDGLPVGPGSPGDLAGGPAGCRPRGELFQGSVYSRGGPYDVSFPLDTNPSWGDGEDRL